MRVLVVSDDVAFGAALAEQVRIAGYDPAGMVAAADTMEAVVWHRPELLIVDAIDPDHVPGVLRRAREAAVAAVPAIVVVPRQRWRAAAQPVSLDEGIWAVLARGEALSETIEAALASAAGSLLGVTPVVIGPLRYEPASRTASVGERSVALTRLEGTLLAAVLRIPGRMVLAEQCAHALWGSTTLDAYRRASLRTHTFTLRRKLDQLGVGSSLVRTPVWGWSGSPADGCRCDGHAGVTVTRLAAHPKGARPHGAASLGWRSEAAVVVRKAAGEPEAAKLPAELLLQFL